MKSPELTQTDLDIAGKTNRLIDGLGHAVTPDQLDALAAGLVEVMTGDADEAARAHVIAAELRRRAAAMRS